MKQFPKARETDLIIYDLTDELLIYDEVRDRAHSLNRPAALVWKLCDGKTSPEEIGKRLRSELSSQGELIDERFVWYAIKQLQNDHLLEEDLEVPQAMHLVMRGRLGRRQVMRFLGLAAIVSVPVVTSIVAPTAAQAASCFASGHACTSGPQCCSGICTSSSCV